MSRDRTLFSMVGVYLSHRLLLLCSLLAIPAAAMTRPRPSPKYQRQTPQERTAVIHFLMLAETGIPYQNIWMRYFAEGDLHKNFEVLVHCQNHEACVMNVRRQDIFSIIPTVPSEYCTDLLSPMIALYKAALDRSDPSSRGDKYVLVSHNSLPVKTFSATQRLLLDRHPPDHAIYSRMSLDRELCKAKASEWSVVSRKQAAFLVEKFNEPLEYDSTNCGASHCPDEFWPIQALLADEQMRHTVHDGKLMYLRWSKQNQSITASLREELQEGLELVHEQGPKGPAFVNKFTPAGLRELRLSEFLFVRKVSDITRVVPKMPLEQAFDRFVFTVRT